MVIKERKSIIKISNLFEENGFITIDRGVMVNKVWIKKINGSENQLILKDDTNLYISARKLKTVLICFRKYLAEVN